MCKHCEADGVVHVEWLPDDMDESCDSFDVPDEEDDDDDAEQDALSLDEDDEDEVDEDDLAWCEDRARLRLVLRVVQEHLCEAHAKAAEAALSEGLAEFLEEAGLQTEAEFVLLDEGEDEVCEECGQPATRAHVVTNEGLYCPAHALEEGATLPPRA